MLNLKLVDIAEKKDLSISIEATLGDLIRLMDKNGRGVVVILEGKKPVGLLTERDVVQILGKNTDLNRGLEQFVKRDIISAIGDRNIGYAISLTLENNIRRVIVINEKGEFVGVVTQQDLLRYLEDDFYRLTLRVKHVLSNNGNLISATRIERIRDVVYKLMYHKISAIPILERGFPVGIVTEKDILRFVSKGISFDERIEKYMTSPVDTVSPETPLGEVVEVMNYRKIRHVIVADKNGIATGILTIRDVVRNLEVDYKRFLEKKLRHAKDILNLFPEMLIEVIDTGNADLIIWVNERVLDKFGGDIIDRPVTEFIPAKYWQNIKSCFERTGKVEGIKIRKDDRIYEISGFLIETPDWIEKARYQIILRDITEDFRLSTTDPLSGLYNKRFINEFLHKEIERSRRMNKQFSVVICDIDDFKRINDNYGHFSGDIVIKEIASLLKKSIRNLDVAGRYGGDEFVIILPEAAGEVAYGIVERLRQEIEKLEIEVTGGKVVKLTASFGISTFPVDGLSSDDLIIASDERLYRAKSLGKNKIAFT